MKMKQFAKRFGLFMLALALLGVGSVRTAAQEAHSHDDNSQQTPEQKRMAGELIKIVRNATERFKDVREAEKAKYSLQFGCVTGPDNGAMGLHFVNMDLVNKGEVDPYHPQIVIYEPQADGRLKLIGADFLVMAEQWDANHPQQPPQLMGQLFHYFETPNRFGLPAFYTLHVWAWKDNPNGAFVNWHPNVSCESFVGETTK
jgi:hypothetical protein